MKLNVILILCLAISMTGCKATSDKLAPPLSADAQSSLSTNDKSIETVFPSPAVDQSFHLISSYLVGNTDAWFLYLEKSNDKKKINTFHSSDKGQTWDQTLLPTSRQWEQGVRKENVFASFHIKRENISNWILLTSDPALGQMGKTLYQSDVNGKSWLFKGDLSSIIDGYVTGVTFRNDLTGWISATQHGTAMLPLYRTKDGGKTWKLQEITIPKDYKYGNAYPPSFDSTNSLLGTLKIDFVGDYIRDTKYNEN